MRGRRGWRGKREEMSDLMAIKSSAHIAQTKEFNNGQGAEMQ